MSEVLIALVIGAIIASLATPALTKVRDAYAVRAARQEIVATVEAARAGAIQRGRPAQFIVRGNAVLAVVDTTPAGSPIVGKYTAAAPQAFDVAYRVTLAVGNPADTAVTYDGRGIANPRLGRVARIRIVSRTVRDSVCLSSFGQLLSAGCKL